MSFLKFRYGVVVSPNFHPSNPNFIISNSRLYSQLHHQEDKDILVSSFNRLLHQNPTPTITHFGLLPRCGNFEYTHQGSLSQRSDP
ncbi:hypothetical protein P8452_51528 [Trifolium repens]|nr:hypothetical protein P8452_51528 [Trifolium repens]